MLLNLIFNVLLNNIPDGRSHIQDTRSPLLGLLSDPIMSMAIPPRVWLLISGWLIRIVVSISVNIPRLVVCWHLDLSLTVNQNERQSLRHLSVHCNGHDHEIVTLLIVGLK